HRRVTLPGPGGVGKTRLSVEAARRFHRNGATADPPPGSVWLVELAGLSDGSLVPLAVLDALGLSERRRLDADGTVLNPSAAGAAERLVEALERQRTLLLLDNCEHLAEP